jgi:ribosomal protein S18 acetylase RimI-like enzyme
VRSEAVKVPAEIVLPLRHAVLRTGRPWANAIYPGDDDPRSAHFAVMDGTTLLAVGSVLPETPDWAIGAICATGAWRVRGMATRRDSRGSGLGSKVVERLVSHVGEHEGGLLWCSARVQAVGLYEKFGFVTRGARYMVRGLGDHATMWTEVAPRGSA